MFRPSAFAVCALALTVAACGGDQTADTGNASGGAQNSAPGLRTGEQTAPAAPKIVETGSDAFETWYVLGDVDVKDRAGDAPDGTVTADEVRFFSDALLSGVWAQTAVAAGDTLEGSVWLWAEQPTEMVVYIAPACQSTSEAPSFEFVTATPEPQKFTVRKTFEEAQGCAQLQLKALQPPATVLAWKAS